MDAGDRIGASDAFRTAAELGDRDPRSMLLLADLAASQEDVEGVIRWSGAVFTTDASIGDSPTNTAQRAIAGALLGSAMLERGHQRAGAQVLTETLERFAAPREPGEPLEFARLRSRRAEFAVLAGDAWASIAQPDQALTAYLSDGSTGVPERPVIVQRSLAATLNAGRAATAALMLLEHLDQASGDLGVEESQWIRGIDRVDQIRGAFGEQLAELIDDPQRPLSERRQILRALARGLSDSAHASSLVSSRGVVARSPVIAGDLLLRSEPGDRESIATDAVRADPMLARAFGAALSRLDEQPALLASRLIASGDPAEIALALGVCVETANASPAEMLLGGPVLASLDTSLVAEACGLLGRWSDADRWLEDARSQLVSSPDRRALFVRALLTTGRHAEAIEVAAGIDADDGASTDDLLVAAETAFVVGDSEAVQTRIARALQIDPNDERLLERQLSFVNDAAESDEGASLRAFGRELAERRPRGALFALLRARDIGGRGRLREAADLIVSVGAREPSRELGVLLLAQAARTADSQGDHATRDFVIGWLARRAEMAPGSTPTAIAYAQALAGTDPKAALASLEDAYRRIGHDDLARAAEALVATEQALADDEELTGPTRRVIQRTADRRDPDSCIERMGAFVRFGETHAAFEAARDALPAGGSLSLDQLRRWEQGMELLSRAVASDATLGGTPEPGSLAMLIDIAESKAQAVGMSIGPNLEQARLLSLVRAGDTDRLDSMIDRRSLGEETGLVVVQALLAGDRVSQGIDLLGRLAVDGNETDPALIDEWARLIGAAGSDTNVRSFLAQLSDNKASEVAGIVSERFNLADLPGETGTQRDRANIAYTGALIASVFERDVEAEGMYRVSLELDPDHAWACNDLGYALAERGERLDEAERLTSRAIEILGERASVLDSLGWVRYKSNIIADQLDELGNITTEGAASLLARAASLEDGQDNPTIATHLGDALWRAGDRDGALRSWSRAESMLRARASEIASSENAGGRASTETAARINAVNRRLTDVKNNRQPRIERLGVGIPDPMLDGVTTYD